MKNGQMYKRMWLSYILMLVVPIGVSFIFYQYTYNAIKEEVTSYHGNLNETIKSSCDRELNYYRSYLEQLNTSDVIRGLGSESNYDSPDVYWDMYVAQTQLSDAFSSMSEGGMQCEGVFLYLKDIDKVISNISSMSYGQYTAWALNLDPAAAEELYEILEKVVSPCAISIVDENAKEYILMIKPSLNIRKGKSKAVIAVLISTEVLEESIRSANWKNGGDWAIIDDQQHIIRYPKKLHGTVEELQDAINRKEDYIIIDNKEYFMQTISSELYNWEYVLFTAEEAVNQTANEIRNMQLGCFFVVLVVGFCLSRVALRLTYNPLKKVIDIFGQSGGKKEFDNEYQYLEKKILLLIEKNSEVRKGLAENKNAIKSCVFEKLLTMGASSDIDSQFGKSIYEKFKRGDNLVLLYSIKDSDVDEDGNEEVIKENELKRFVVANVFSEGIGKMFAEETQEYGGYVVSIVNIPEEIENYTEKLQEVVGVLTDLIFKCFHFEVCTMEGGIYKGIEGIQYSFLEANQVEGFSTIINENYIRYEDIKDRMVRKYQYSFEMEECVINAIRTHNASLANSYINSVLENNMAEDSALSSDMRLCLLYDIFTTLLKASEEIGINLDGMTGFNRFSENTTLEDAKSRFHAMVEDICIAMEAVPKNSFHTELCQSILAYIEENFTDPDINISQTALQFHMTPAYMSAIFKKQTGESILEVIKRLRIEYAKKLLADGVSVSEVFGMVGFRDIATFIRCFKALTGVTPGQMKKK